MRDPPRWVRRTAAALGAVAVLCVGVWLRSGEADAPASARPAPLPPSLWSAAFEAVKGARQTIRQVAAGAPHGVDEVQRCSGEWTQLQAREEDADRAALPTSPAGSDARRAGILAALRASPDELARAAAVWLDVPASQDLAALAVSSHNPALYALAFHNCRQLGNARGTCQLINAAQWARLAPDNAQPWLFMLSEAVQRKDMAAQNEALFHIGTAKRSDMGWATIPGLITRTASRPAQLRPSC